MSPRWPLSAAMFLALVPVTLLVPGLNELVIEAHGGSTGDAHAFMTLNLLAGMVVVPPLMGRLHRLHDLRRWIAAFFLVDALAFVGMGRAESLGQLYVFRLIDGAVHLPSVTFLMVLANRTAGERRGASLGALASALMLGVMVGSPLGGWLVQRGVAPVYGTGAVLFGIGALCCAVLPRVDATVEPSRRGARYRWQWRRLEAWIPLGYAFMDRFSIGVFVSTFTLFLAREHLMAPPARGVLVALFMIPFAALCYPVGRLAERVGWFAPLVSGNIVFGLVYGSYGYLPNEFLPAAMVLSGIASAFVFAPSLLLVSDLARRGHGEGLFGVFQVAGSLGFLCGPAVGGLLVSLSGAGRPFYERIFLGVGMAELLLAAGSIVVLRRLRS